MKLSKVHIALLTNVTEGKVKNEHITMRYWKEVNANTVWERMRELNLRLPVDLYLAANRERPSRFVSWNGDRITSVMFNLKEYVEHEYTIFSTVAKPHITIAKNVDEHVLDYIWSEYPSFNWEEGLKVGECHVGWKENGEMVYRTESELIDWIANNA